MNDTFDEVSPYPARKTPTTLTHGFAAIKIAPI